MELSGKITTPAALPPEHQVTLPTEQEAGRPQSQSGRLRQQRTGILATDGSMATRLFSLISRTMLSRLLKISNKQCNKTGSVRIT
jgi:hypothetical protein